MSIFNKIFGDSNDKLLKALQPTVEQINSLEKRFEKLSDKDLEGLTEKFRQRLKNGEDEDKLLPQAYAAVREAMKRSLKMRHFDVQIMAGIVLHQGKIAEQRTGEGKTLSATLPLYLNALSGQGAHLVTVNDYLARLHASWMGPVYRALGMSVSAICQQNKSYIYDPEYKKDEEFSSLESVADKDDNFETIERSQVGIKNLRPISRKEAYACDITYGTNNEFGFDYLRDNMVRKLEDKVQRGLNYAIIDEVDSILIDEARTPLIISAPAEESASLYQKFARLVPQLKENQDYNVDEKDKAATLTDAGIRKMEKMLGMKNIYQEGGVTLVHYLEQALKAQTLFKKDRDYVVKNGEIIIVDEFTGRLMFGRRFSEGLHQAIEAKEGVEVKRESITMATISFQNLFRLYDKLSGMTGTAKTEEEEFYKIYGLEVVVIPTHKPMIRKDLPDQIYKGEEGKFRAVVREIVRRNKKGQPILVGTISVEKSEHLSRILKREGVKHEVLNAKHHEREGKIIAQAGKKGKVTIATNMAGRGVDISISKEVMDLGGLHIIGTERHESRRIDNQLRGRSGRQGEPGSSQFFVSMEDDLMRIFGGERIKRIMETLHLPEDQSIENKLISRSIEQAQKRVEGHNFDIRKHLVEYDDVLNKQRNVIYSMRNRILAGKSTDQRFPDLRTEIKEILKGEMKRICDLHASFEDKKEWNLKEIVENLKTILPEDEVPSEEDLKKYGKEELKETLQDLVAVVYEEKRKTAPKIMEEVEKAVYLRSIDSLWVDHLTNIEELREGIGLRGYGQRDPLTEYKREAFRLFENLKGAIEEQIVHLILKIEFEVRPEPLQAPLPGVSGSGVIMRGGNEQAAAGTFAGVRKQTKGNEEERLEGKEGAESGAISAAKVGRNDPCPCGSGKKYKKCCGR